MSESRSALPRSVVITRLRAAGCVFAEDEADLLLSAARTPAELAAMVERRAGGLPLEHILGWAEFFGLRMAVDPGVFVPRRRTEFLVRQALALCRPGTVVVDLCCGSGAVGAALASAAPQVDLYATDIDPAAVRCARRNLPAGARVFAGDLVQPLPAGLRGRVDVLVANAPSWLGPGGYLLVETSARQAPRTAEIFARNGLVPRVAASAELNATVVIGTAAG
jgi:release factor glutamine methyltransferase